MRRAIADPPELPGHTFVRALGSGGFSDVFLYEQKLPRRRVAVKVLISDEVTAASRAAFVGEANSMAQLSAHPYIVSIFHADVASDGRPYFVMEYCSGPSLAERYKNERFTVADALRTGVRLSSAIATAHSAGILHRDIKPANVLTNDYGWPALTDFGISSAVEDDSFPAHTTTGNPLADSATTGGESIGMSVPWSPPEMFDDDPQPDVRSDVFSLAATIYTILAGFTPFEVPGRPNGALDLIGRIERGAVTPLDRGDVPRSLVAVLRKGMETDRTRRFDTAIDFARALQRVELELGYSATAIDVPGLDIAPTLRAADVGDDSTRVRTVSTIEAQPPATRAPAGLVGLPPAASGGQDATVVRSAKTVQAQPAPLEETVVRPAALRGAAPTSAPSASSHPATDGSPAGKESAGHATASPDTPSPDTPTPDTPTPDTPTPDTDGPGPVGPESRRRRRTDRLVIGVAGGAVVVVAVAVALSLTVFGRPTGPDIVRPTAGQDGPVVLGQIQSPTLVSSTVEGSELVFTVENPDPVEGDIFLWRRTGLTSAEPPRSTEEGRIVVPDYTAGQTVCISVTIVRAGRESANPLEPCYP
ncbi:MAG: hypothetical protein RI885_1191 [Actinomycetota bacterium]